MAIKKKLIVRIKKIRKPTKKKLIRISLLILLFASVCILGIILGVYTAISQNLPSISELEEFKPSIITYIYSDSGEVIGEYAIEKRIEVTYQDIPEILIEAIIATEDPRFYNHAGIDFRGILRAFKEDIKIRRRPGRLHGGSTISQQLAREIGRAHV